MKDKQNQVIDTVAQDDEIDLVEVFYVYSIILERLFYA